MQMKLYHKVQKTITSFRVFNPNMRIDHEKLRNCFRNIFATKKMGHNQKLNNRAFRINSELKNTSIDF